MYSFIFPSVEVAHTYVGQRGAIAAPEKSGHGRPRFKRTAGFIKQPRHSPADVPFSATVPPHSLQGSDGVYLAVGASTVGASTVGESKQRSIGQLRRKRQKVRSEGGK